MEIKPNYVTFEQAKLLVKKGFDVFTNAFYQENGVLIDDIEGIPYNYICKQLIAPEQWLVIEWFRLKYKIEIYLRPERNSNLGITTYYYGIDKICTTNHLESINVVDLFNSKYPTPQETYSAAIDYVLNNLIK
jgi:hypothetical protein